MRAFKVLKRWDFYLSCGLIMALVTTARAADPPITALAFDPTGSELIAGSQRGIERLSWPDLQSQGELDSRLVQIHDIRFSPDGKTLAIAGGIPGEEGQIEAWTWPELKNAGAYSLHADVIYQAVWSGDSQRIFTSSHDGEVLEIFAASGAVVRRYSGHSQPVRSVCLLENHQTLLSAGNDQTIRVWNTKTGQLVRSLNNHTQAVFGLALRPSPDNNALPQIASIGADGTVRLWQPTIGRMMRFLRLPASKPLSLAWSKDGKELLIADDGGALWVLNPDTLEILATKPAGIQRPISLVLTPDGKAAVLGGENGKLQKVGLR